MPSQLCHTCLQDTDNPRLSHVRLMLDTTTTHYQTYSGYCDSCDCKTVRIEYDADSYDDGFPPPPNGAVSFDEDDPPADIPNWAISY